jgi:hypothetical protein
MIGRFDIPESAREVMSIAVKSCAIDAAELYSLATKHGDDWRGLVNEIVEIAFTLHHFETGRQIHAAVCEAADKFFEEVK